MKVMKEITKENYESLDKLGIMKIMKAWIKMKVKKEIITRVVMKELIG